MENRDRDKLGQNSSSSDKSELNRNAPSNIGNKGKSDSSVDFGKNIGRSEEWNEEPSRISDRGSSEMQGSGHSRMSSPSKGNGGGNVTSSSSKLSDDQGRGSQGGNRS
jgi:hypothetical protein